MHAARHSKAPRKMCEGGTLLFRTVITFMQLRFPRFSLRAWGHSKSHAIANMPHYSSPAPPATVMVEVISPDVRAGEQAGEKI